MEQDTNAQKKKAMSLLLLDFTTDVWWTTILHLSFGYL
jgi:hypothetical protein